MLRRVLAAVLLAVPGLGLADALPGDSAVPGASQAPPQGILTRSPELLTFVPAERPPGTEGLTADIVLLLTVQADGTVGDVQLQSGAGNALDQAAMEAARKFVFSPAEVDHKPAAVQLVYRYSFTLEEQKVQVAVPVDAGRPVGVLRGVVLERGTRKPLPGIIVKVEPVGAPAPGGQEPGGRSIEPVGRQAGGVTEPVGRQAGGVTEPVGRQAGGVTIETFTDAEGKFELPGLDAGPVVVRIDDAAYYRIADKEAVVAGQATEVNYYLERATGENELVVVGRRVKKDVARQTLTLTEIRKIPGASGDALKVVQNLPGVARSPFGGGQLVVRGSSPGDSAAVINRHVVPLAYHFGGLRSVFSSSLLESIDFYPGNFGAEYGRLQGGIVDVKVRRPKTDRYHGLVEADFYDAGFLVEGPVLENGAFAIAGRRSYIDFLLPLFLPSDANLDFTVAPRYYDCQAIYDWKEGRHQIKLYFFGSNDELRFLLEQPVDADPALRGNFRTETGFYRLYLNWIYRVTDDVTHDFSVSAGRNLLYFSGSEKFFFDNRLWVVTARDDLEVEFSKKLKLRTGVDLEAYIGHIAVRSPPPPKEGRGGGGGSSLSSLPLVETSVDLAVVSPAVWLEFQARPVEDLLVVPGVRLDYDQELQDLSIDPRVNARYQIIEGTTLKGGVGAYMQRPDPDEADENYGNPDIKLEHSIQSQVGVEQKLPWDVTLDGSFFYKYLHEQVTLGQTDQQTAGITGTSSRTAGVPYENHGHGRVYGLEMLVRKELTDRLFGWVSYTLSRAERKDAPGDDWRVFDFDQTHILSVLGQYSISSTWDLGFRWRYVTGNPQTVYKGCFFESDTKTCSAKPDGGVNSARLPAFHQLDLRVDRKWIFDWWILTAYLEIQNAYNRQNPEGYTYNFDFTERKLVSGIPILPSFGLRGEF